MFTAFCMEIGLIIIVAIILFISWAFLKYAEIPVTTISKIVT